MHFLRKRKPFEFDCENLFVGKYIPINSKYEELVKTKILIIGKPLEENQSLFS